jgi:hypothetical protein
VVLESVAVGCAPTASTRIAAPPDAPACTPCRATLAPMLERVVPGVVNISTTSRVRVAPNALLDNPFFRQFFDIPQVPREIARQSLGSGVIVDAAAGLVLTSQHVIANAEEIDVTLPDGELRAATSLAAFLESDGRAHEAHGILAPVHAWFSEGHDTGDSAMPPRCSRASCRTRPAPDETRRRAWRAAPQRAVRLHVRRHPLADAARSRARRGPKRVRDVGGTSLALVPPRLEVPCACERCRCRAPRGSASRRCRWR